MTIIIRCDAYRYLAGKGKINDYRPFVKRRTNSFFFFYTHEHTPHSTKLFLKISMYIKMK